MNRIQYKIVELDCYFEEMESEMNKYGKTGWDIFKIENTSDAFILFMKRISN